jgi:hypothetical protein
MYILDYYYCLYGFNQPNVGEADRAHATKPIRPFPLLLFRCSKVFLQARSRGEEGDVLPLWGTQLIVWRALYNVFFSYLCAFSRFFVLDSAWRNKFILVSSKYSIEDQSPHHLFFLLFFRKYTQSYLPNHPLLLVHP